MKKMARGASIAASLDSWPKPHFGVLLAVLVCHLPFTVISCADVAVDALSPWFPYRQLIGALSARLNWLSSHTQQVLENGLMFGLRVCGCAQQQGRRQR